MNGENLGNGTTLTDTGSFGTPDQPLDLGWASIAEGPVLAYLRAVGDEQPIYTGIGLAPPMFGVAMALGQILQRRALPPGAIHSLQEFDTLRPIPIGSELRVACRLERQRERAGLRFLTFGIDMNTPDGDTALAIKTTLMVPGETPQDAMAPPGQYGEPPTPKRRQTERTEISEMTTVSRNISGKQLSEYAEVSGDDNPLHLDDKFAAGTQFGGVIAHGMLTLAFVSEMLTASLGDRWLAGGSLRARFKGAAYPGDCVETWGRPAKSDGGLESYAIGLLSRNTGEDLITGTATVKTN